mmetsp:Transcript_25136/g.65251  ORF Transcript_25136/g.65251 Transcript_25136/m.65251 type:complete len:108 (+) Transcript_25136:256-579(+)
MAFDPFARLEDDDANDGGYESDGPLGSGAPFVSKALTPAEQAAMQVRGGGGSEAEAAPVAAHLKDQGAGLKLENTVLHSFGKEVRPVPALSLQDLRCLADARPLPRR